MFSRIMLGLGVVVLISCSTAKMAVDPGLEVNSDKYQITERAKVFSGGNVVFGPYRASRISRSAIRSSRTSFIGIGKEKEGQSYTYQFKGKSKRSWRADCRVLKGNRNFGRISRIS